MSGHHPWGEILRKSRPSWRHPIARLRRWRRIRAYRKQVEESIEFENWRHR